MSKPNSQLRTIKRVLDECRVRTPKIRIALIDLGDSKYLRLHEGTWIGGRFPNRIRIDQPTHQQGGGQPHAHVYGRKGNEIVVVNLNGTGSHGSRGVLHRNDADALTARGFAIRSDRIVEWWVDPNAERLEFLLR